MAICVYGSAHWLRHERKGEKTGKEGRGGEKGGTTVPSESVWDSAGVFDTAESCWLRLALGSKCWGRLVDRMCGV